MSQPDMCLPVSAAAGYDAAEGDPLGACHVTTECYAWMTEQLQAVAPLVVLLEGGYNLSITAASTEACMRVLLGQRAPRLPEHRRTPSLAGMAVIQHVVRVQVRPLLSRPCVPHHACTWPSHVFLSGPCKKILRG